MRKRHEVHGLVVDGVAADAEKLEKVGNHGATVEFVNFVAQRVAHPVVAPLVEPLVDRYIVGNVEELLAHQAQQENAEESVACCEGCGEEIARLG